MNAGAASFVPSPFASSSSAGSASCSQLASSAAQGQQKGVDSSARIFAHHHQRRSNNSRPGSGGQQSVTNANDKGSQGSSTRNHNRKKPHHRGNRGSVRPPKENAEDADRLSKSSADLDTMMAGAGIWENQEVAPSPGRKGQISLNHLLSFTFPPRQHPSVDRPNRIKRGSNYQPYNKERFLNANFRFVVNPTSNYTPQLVDPDAQVDWEVVEQAVISYTRDPSCPICLGYPTAPRVTKCGHAFCLVCILHYLSLSEDQHRQWRKCPICWDCVYAKDLKPVRFWKVQSVGKVIEGPGGTVIAPQDDETVAMQLMYREMDSTVALPKRANQHAVRRKADKFRVLPSHFTPGALAFAKLMLASADYLESQLRNDEREVLSVLAEAKRLDADENEVPFVEMALVNIRERVNALKSAGWNTNEMVLKNEIIARAEAEAVDREARAANRRAVGEPCQQPAEGEAGRSAGMETARSMQPVEQPQQVREGMGRGNRQARRKDGRTDSYYFFQARDGQHLYLHPLDIRVLKQEYGDYDEFPETITVRVVGVEESTLTEELRKRCRYLSHLPLSCDVTFVEVDWQGLVGEETMKMFTGEFRERKERQAAKRARDTGVASQNLRRRQVRVPSPLPSTSSTSQLSQPVEDDPFFATLNSSAGKEDPVAAGRHGPSGSFAAVASGRGQSSGTRGAWGAAAVDQHESDDHPSNVWWGDYDDDEIAAAGKGKKKFVLMSSGGARRGKYR